MKKWIFIIMLSSSLFAADVKLEAKNIELNLGDITELAIGEIVSELKLIQTSSTPKRVKIKLSYKTPGLHCTRKQAYIYTPYCSEEDQRWGRCYSEIRYRCVQYGYDLSSRERVVNTKVIKLKFKTKTQREKVITLEFSKNIFELRGSPAPQIIDRDYLFLQPKLISSDFNKTKTRRFDLINGSSKIILK